MTATETHAPHSARDWTELLAAVANDTAPQARAVRNPATGDVIASYLPATPDDAREAITRARAAQPAWAARSDEERCAALLAAADAVEAHAEALAQILSREQGKPLNGPNARFEVGACSAWLRVTCAHDIAEATIVDDGETRATLSYKPIGVVGAIGPWNWPMMITIWQVAPALRMGNTVVVKPSEYTPLSVLALCHVLASVLPEGTLQVVPGDGAVGEVLSTDARVGKVMFTGSTRTGRAIAQAAGATNKRLTLELGGNDAGIVLDDVDPAAIAEGLFWGAFINTGQTCAALKRLYVHEAVYEQVCEELVKVATAMPMGEGIDENNVLGPLQNRAQFEIVSRLVSAAVDSGARVLCGADPNPEQPGFFYPTTLIADIDPDNPLVTEEQFGPALPIIRFTDVEWAIEQANKLDVGLGGSVWSGDAERARAIARRLETGTVWINSHGGVDPRIPFGGIKGSGFGVEFGPQGLKELAVHQVING